MFDTTRQKLSIKNVVDRIKNPLARVKTDISACQGVWGPIPNARNVIKPAHLAFVTTQVQRFLLIVGSQLTIGSNDFTPRDKLTKPIKAPVFALLSSAFGKWHKSVFGMTKNVQIVPKMDSV